MRTNSILRFSDEEVSEENVQKHKEALINIYAIDVDKEINDIRATGKVTWRKLLRTNKKVLFKQLKKVTK